MLTGGLYLLAFLIGMFIVWKMGRDEYYDEERLIDLVLFTSSVGLLVSRLGYFVTPPGQKELMLISQSDNVWLGLLRFFQLNNGNIWWAGVAAFFLMAIFLLWKWSWPVWPMLGVLVLGAGTSITLSELFVWYFRGLHWGGVVLMFGLFTVGLMVYNLRLGGDKIVGDFFAGFEHGRKKKHAEIRERKQAKYEAKHGHQQPHIEHHPHLPSSPISHINLHASDDPKKAY